MKHEEQIITIVLAISSSKVMDGIQLLLEMEPDISIIGKATNGIEAMNIVQMIHPQVLIMELMIGQIRDIELIKQTIKLSPETNIIIFSLYDAASYMKEVFQAGAKAYVLKESQSYELTYAVRKVVAGQRYVSPPLSDITGIG
ncbi:MAG: response regulator transcription factor [Dehalococcoidia bacterium]